MHYHLEPGALRGYDTINLYCLSLLLASHQLEHSSYSSQTVLINILKISHNETNTMYQSNYQGQTSPSAYLKTISLRKRSDILTLNRNKKHLIEKVVEACQPTATLQEMPSTRQR